MITIHMKSSLILSLFFICFTITHGSDASTITTDYNGCIFSLNDSNGVTATYNLSRFHLADKVYSVKQDDYEYTQREYKFNICGRIPENIWKSNDYIWPRCRNNSVDTHGSCQTWRSNGTCEKRYDITTEEIYATGVQYTNSPHCHWAGSQLNGLDGLPDYNVSLIDSGDSAGGIRYTLLNGDVCAKYSKGARNTNRELNVELVCPDSNRKFFNPDRELNFTEDVVQYPLCIYTITVETALACPSECIATQKDGKNDDGNTHSVCNGRGICVSDPNYGKVRCICDDGYTGDLCDTQQEYDIEVIYSKNGTINSVITICIILLGLLVICALFLCHKIRLQEEEMKGTHGQYVQSMLNDGNESDDDIHNVTNVTNVSATGDQGNQGASTVVTAGSGGANRGNPLLDENDDGNDDGNERDPNDIANAFVTPQGDVAAPSDDVDENRVP